MGQCALCNGPMENDTKNAGSILNASYHFTEEIVRSKYTMHNKIGRGQFGIVKRATICNVPCKGASHDRAVKVLSKKKILSHDNAVQCLRNEVTIGMSVDHPSLLPIFEAIETPDHVYLFMPLVDGGSLREMLRDSMSASTGSDWVNTTKVLAAGLRHLHEKEIMHGDIKPENIMYNYETKSHMWVDFGMSRKIGARSSPADGQGTLQYCAPEVYAQKKYGLPSDIWSFGIVIFELISLETPYEVHHVDEFKKADPKHHQTLKLLHEGNFDMDTPHQWKGVDPFAKDLIRSMTLVDPKKRPSAMAVENSTWVSKHTITNELL